MKLTEPDNSVGPGLYYLISQKKKLKQTFDLTLKVHNLQAPSSGVYRSILYKKLSSFKAKHMSLRYSQLTSGWQTITASTTQRFKSFKTTR